MAGLCLTKKSMAINTTETPVVVDYDSIKGTQKVRFMKIHPRFAHVKGDEPIIKKSEIARHKLIELDYAHAVS